MEKIIRAAALAAEPRRLQRVAPAVSVRHVAPATGAPLPPAAPSGATSLPATVAEPPSLSEEELQQRYAGPLARLRQQAQEQGYAAGMAHAEQVVQQAIDQHGERVGALAAALQRTQEELWHTVHDRALEVAYAAVCQLLGQDSMQPEIVQALVTQAVAQCREQQGLTVRLHPRDLELLQACAPSPVLAGMALQADATLTCGGCMIDGLYGSLDARLERQLERLRAVLLGFRQATGIGAPVGNTA